MVATPAPMPIISQGLPSFASNITFPPNRGNNTTYADSWRSVDVPSVGTPIWWAVDVSTVPVAQRVVQVNLLNELGQLYYNVDTSQATLLMADYKLQGNVAAGGAGSAPVSGWVDLVTVTGNLYPTRVHALDLTTYNWMRFICTASNGPVSNNDCALQIDMHDAHLGAGDRWLCVGDSITLEGMAHGQLGGGDWGYGGHICSIVSNLTAGKRYPLMIDAGNGGETQTWANANKAGLLSGFNNGYVICAFGTNDANQNFPYVFGGTQCTTFYSDLLGFIDACAAQGNAVILPYIPWGSNNGGNLGLNAQTLNSYVDSLIKVDRPNVVRGPDFWTFFNNNPGLIRDGIHPTFTEVSGARSGYEEMHRLWAAWMVANVYSPGSAIWMKTLCSTAVQSPVFQKLGGG